MHSLPLVGAELRLLPPADKGANMEKPFQFGTSLGQNMKENGWSIKGKSREILKHEARKLITLGYPNETEEDKNAVIAGILHVWSDGDDGGPWTECDLWL
jgi:hypothetical protein